jgi:hypothetical protein
MASIMAANGVILARPTGGVLATSCGQSLCHPCIGSPQNAAGLSIAGPCLGDSGSILHYAPATIGWCENWQSGSWPWSDTCAFTWAADTDASSLVGPGAVFSWVLIVGYRAASGTFDAMLLWGWEIVSDGDPCNWLVSPTPVFAATGIATTQNANPSHYLACGPDGRLSGTFTMQGHTDPLTGNPLNCTATVTL